MRARRRDRWIHAALILTLAALAGSAAARLKPLSALELKAAEKLYRDGVLPDGRPLRGARQSGTPIEGQAAACVNCHQRSGFGLEEGRILIPPIAGKYLFRDGSMDLLALAHPESEARPRRRSRYGSQTLTRAIREGLDPDGRALDYLMPRYALDDASMSLLIDYLKQLSTHPVPGALNDTLQFATIVTPDADPVKRDAMLDVLNHFFADKNHRAVRRWQLHAWELKGSPDAWEAQLQQNYRAEPVFAVISGIGARTWEPVHRFCEAKSLPCLLPNVDLPVVAEGDFYPIYFSRGVLLEADVIVNRLRGDSGTPTPQRIVQAYRPDDIGAAAARRLTEALTPLGARITAHELKSRHPASELSALVTDAAGADALVLWLRPEDLKALPAGVSPGGKVFVSGLMGGLENTPLPDSWRGAARLTYPFDLPAQRRIHMPYPLGWFKIQHVQVVDERTQTDTFIACSILVEAASSLLDNFVPDYLIERVQADLSHRLINGYYPRLGLAPGQRFASKGAYLVRLADTTGNRIVADGDWIVP